MQSNQPADTGFFVSLAVFILVTAAEAFGLNLVWNHVVTVAFEAKPMLFGHMFLMVLAIRVFFRDVLKMGDILDVLEEIKEIQYFTANNTMRQAAKETEKSDISDVSDK